MVKNCHQDLKYFSMHITNYADSTMCVHSLNSLSNDSVSISLHKSFCQIIFDCNWSILSYLLDPYALMHFIIHLLSGCPKKVTDCQTACLLTSSTGINTLCGFKHPITRNVQRTHLLIHTWNWVKWYKFLIFYPMHI